MQDADASADAAQTARGTDAKQAFLRRLRDHLDSGTRPAGEQPRPWANEEFVTSTERAVVAINKTSKDRTRAPNLRTVQSWRQPDDTPLPQKRFLEPVIWALFGETGAHCPQAQELRDLHQRAGYREPKARPKAGAEGPPLPSGAAGQWIPEEKLNSRPLAELIIHKPGLSNQPDETVALPVSVSLGRDEVEIDGRNVELTLSGASITPTYVNCGPEDRFAEGDTHPDVMFEGGVWNLSGPLIATQLATIVFTATGEPEATLELYSHKRQIEVVLRGGKKPTTTLREKLVQLYTQEKLQTASGSAVVLGRSTLRRKPR